MLKLITLFLTSMMTVMAGTTIVPALPQIEAHFHAQPNVNFWVKLMLTIPGLFTAIAAPFSGIFIDRYGRKPLLVGATLLCGFAGGSGLILNSLVGLLIGRALLGVAVGAIMTTATALIADYYQGPRRNQVMGTQAAFMSFGGVVFLTLGGFLADLGWRFPFAIYLLAFLISVLVIFFLTEPNREVTELVLNEFQERESIPWTVIGVIYVLTFLTIVAFYMVPVQLPFYLKELTQGQITNSQTGMTIASLTLASALISTRYKMIKSHLNFQGILVCLYILTAVGYILIGTATNYWGILIGLIVAGMGLGLMLPNMNVWLNTIAPPAIRGRALGGLTTAMFLGQFFSPVFSQPLIRQVGLGAMYGWTGAILGGLAIIILGLSMFKARI